MGLIINNYKQSVMSNNGLSKQTNTLNKLSERLSTAVKINHASDDSAGLIIAESLLSAYSGTLMARANIEDTVSLLKVADSDLSAIKSNMSVIRELSIRAANDTNGTLERDAINSEIQGRMDEIERISASSSYNGKNLLDGSSTELSVQIGSDSEDLLTLGSDILGNANLATFSLLNDTSKLLSSGDYRSFIDKVDSALEVSSHRISNLGSVTNRLESANMSLSVTSGNLLSSKSLIRDADIAHTMSQMVNSQILQKASVGVLSISNKSNQLYSQLM